MRFPRARRLVAAIVVALCAAEGCLRCLGGIGAVGDLQESHYVITDLWQEVSRPLRLPGRPLPDPDFLRAVPTYPRSLIPGLRLSRRMRGAEQRFTTRPCPNAEVGYRINGTEEDAQPVYGVVVGDSMTEGAHVDDAQTYVSRLSRMSGKRFVNLGVFAQGTTGDLKRLELSGFLDSRPRVVILQVNPNDVEEDLELEADVPLHDRRLAPGLAPRHSQRRTFMRRLNWAMMRRSLLFFLLETSLGWGPGGSPLEPADESSGAGIQKANLERFYALARRHRAKLVVVEDGTRIQEDFHWPPGPRGDVALVSPGVPMEQRIRFDGHWNAQGHERAARLVFERLRALGWLGP